MKPIRTGIIGLGGRGSGMIKLIAQTEGVNVTAVCDIYEDRCQKSADLIEEISGERPYSFTDYTHLLALEEVDAVVIMTSWTDHIRIAIDAMKAGKYTALEVGGAYSVDECWALVHTYEQTKVPCMMLENCCYGRDELMVLNMVKQGIFGEIVHCQGGYRHDLRYEIAYGKENRHYRLNNYLNRNCENYPTHELGPIAKVLDINRGNRLVSLTSVASKARGMHEYIVSEKGNQDILANKQFAQGDVVTTIIKCAHGESIVLFLDTTLPRPYSRGFHVQGTKGMYTEDNRSIFIDGESDHTVSWQKSWNNIEQYREKYEHPLWKKFLKDGVDTDFHGGIDMLVLNAFFDSIKNGVQPPIDVYDAATWACITPLSEASIALGGHPVDIPDFTGGKWIEYSRENVDLFGI